MIRVTAQHRAMSLSPTRNDSLAMLPKTRYDFFGSKTDPSILLLILFPSFLYVLGRPFIVQFQCVC